MKSANVDLISSRLWAIMIAQLVTPRKAISSRAPDNNLKICSSLLKNNLLMKMVLIAKNVIDDTMPRTGECTTLLLTKIRAMDAYETSEA